MHPTRRISSDFTTAKLLYGTYIAGSTTAPCVPLSCYVPPDPVDFGEIIYKVNDGAANVTDATCIWSINMAIKTVNTGAAGVYGFNVWNSVSDVVNGVGAPIYRAERSLAVGEADTITVNFPKGFIISGVQHPVDPGGVNATLYNINLQDNSGRYRGDAATEVPAVSFYWPSAYTANGILTITYSYVSLADAANC